MKVRSRFVSIDPYITPEEVSGVYIPDARRKNVPKGKITSVGELVEGLEVGQEVVYFPSANVEVDGLHIVHEEDVIAIL